MIQSPFLFTEQSQHALQQRLGLGRLQVVEGESKVADVAAVVSGEVQNDARLSFVVRVKIAVGRVDLEAGTLEGDEFLDGETTVVVERHGWVAVKEPLAGLDVAVPRVDVDGLEPQRLSGGGRDGTVHAVAVTPWRALPGIVAAVVGPPDVQIVSDEDGRGRGIRLVDGQRVGVSRDLRQDLRPAQASIDQLLLNIESVNPEAAIIHANSPVVFDEDVDLAGKRVLVIEDGPTLTHGGMKIGAGTVAAQAAGAVLVDPREHAVGKMAETYAKYPGIGTLLPAMGYSPEQVADLQTTVNAVDCDYVVIGTPIDLRKVIDIEKPSVRVGYDLEVKGSPNLEDVLGDLF